MLREAIYALAGIFCVFVVFFTLIPAWGTFEGTMGSVWPNLVTDTTYQNGLLTLPTNLNNLVMYSFAALIIGLFMYILIIPWMQEVTTPSY